MKNGFFSRYLSLALVIGMLLTTVIGCTDSNTDVTDVTDADSAATEEATEEVTDRSQAKDNLPDLNYNDATVRIHGRGDSGAIYELTCEQTGDVVDDAIYNRNRKVEERLGIKLEAYTPYGWQEYSNALNQIYSSIQSGDDEFQLIAAWSAYGPSLAVEDGLLMNLNEVDYLDTSMPWWSQTIVNELDINGNLSFITGDISLTMIASAYTIAANNDVATDYNISGIDDLVLNKQWTIDKLYEMASAVYSDVDGNGEKNMGDTVGMFIGIDWRNDAKAFTQGSKITFTSRDENGLPYIDADIEKLDTLAHKVYDIFYTCPGTLIDENEESEMVFGNGNILFTPAYLIYYVSQYKSMEDDYSILPYPLFDENQSSYSTCVQDGVSIWCIPTTVQDVGLSGATLEALCAESYRLVTPAYFDTALKVKYTRNSASGQMLDMIRDGIFFNFEIIYGGELGGIYNTLISVVTDKNPNVASDWAANKDMYVNKLSELLEKLSD